jgi:isoquinoline 1-oxidoreductase beta subunit
MSSNTFKLDRRGFLAATGGLVVGFVLPAREALAQGGGGGLFGPPPDGKPNAYIRIGADDSVTFFIPKSEMGQGPTTACSQMLAEELECDWTKVKMQVAAGRSGFVRSPDDRWQHGRSHELGSACARRARRRAEMLIAAAGTAVERQPVAAARGKRVRDQSVDQSAHQLRRDRRRRVASAGAGDRDAEGSEAVQGHRQAVKRLDTRDKVTAKAMFGLDARPEGLVYAA